MKNLNTSSHTEFWWPHARTSQSSFRRHLKTLGLYAPIPLMAHLIRRAAKVENLVYKNLLKPVGIRRRFRPWQRIRGSRQLFQWANHELKRHYEEGLKKLDHAKNENLWNGKMQ